MRHRFLLLILVGLCALISGCVTPSRPPVTHPVHGKVRFDGKQLDSGVVEFQPLDESARHAQGEIQPDGTYALSILHEGKGVPGAVPGEYRVTVLFMAKAEKDKRPPIAVEKTYKVVEGDNTFNLELKSP